MKRKPIQMYPSDRVRKRVEEYKRQYSHLELSESAAANALIQELIDREEDEGFEADNIRQQNAEEGV